MNTSEFQYIDIYTFSIFNISYFICQMSYSALFNGEYASVGSLRLASIYQLIDGLCNVRVTEHGSLVLTLHNTFSWMTMKTVHSEICRKSIAGPS